MIKKKSLPGFAAWTTTVLAKLASSKPLTFYFHFDYDAASVFTPVG